MRTLPITAAEVPVILAAIQSGEHVWLVREGRACDLPTLHDTTTHPPVEFTLACAPCETSRGSRSLSFLGNNPCEDCRIELVGADDWCENCQHVPMRHCRVDHHRIMFGGAIIATRTLGYAYAVGRPLPIVAAVALHGANLAALSWPNVQVSQRGDALTLASGNDWSPSSDLTDHLAHYGPPELLTGWAVELAVTA